MTAIVSHTHYRTTNHKKIRLAKFSNFLCIFIRFSLAKYRNWTFWFGGFYIAGLIFLLLFAQVENNFDLSSVKFTIVLTVIISIGFLVLNLFIKLSTSNFHLANDARERHHLTYVYLALLNETDISGEEKSIVLQSLFSRAESGLIRSDSGPQLPGNQAINALIKKEGHR